MTLDNNTTRSALMCRKAAAREISYAPSTLAKWECKKIYDLEVVRSGRSVRYKRSVIDRIVREGLTPFKTKH